MLEFLQLHYWVLSGSLADTNNSSQTAVVLDTAKINDMSQLTKNSNDLAQLNVLQDSANKAVNDGKVIVETVVDTLSLQEIQVGNSNLGKPQIKAVNSANANVEEVKNTLADVKLSNVADTENKNAVLTNMGAVQNLNTQVDSKVNSTIEANVNADSKVNSTSEADVNTNSTLTETLSVPDKTVRAQITAPESAANHAEQPNANQFSQFVTMSANRVDNNTSSAAMATPVGTQEMVQYDIPGQIVEQARLIKGTEDTQMVIKLKPEHLGELTLKVTVENGAVSASFHSDNSQVRGLLETTLVQLKQELNSQGIKVDTVGVYGGLGEFLSDGQSQPGQQGQNSRFKNRKINLDDFEDEVDKVGGLMSASGVTDDGVDYRV